MVLFFHPLLRVFGWPSLVWSPNNALHKGYQNEPEVRLDFVLYKYLFRGEDIKQDLVSLKKYICIFFSKIKCKINARLIRIVLITMDTSSKRQMLDNPHVSNFKNAHEISFFFSFFFLKKRYLKISHLISSPTQVILQLRHDTYFCSDATNIVLFK